MAQNIVHTVAASRPNTLVRLLSSASRSNALTFRSLSDLKPASPLMFHWNNATHSTFVPASEVVTCDETANLSVFGTVNKFHVYCSPTFGFRPNTKGSSRAQFGSSAFQRFFLSIFKWMFCASRPYFRHFVFATGSSLCVIAPVILLAGWTAISDCLSLLRWRKDGAVEEPPTPWWIFHVAYLCVVFTTAGEYLQTERKQKAARVVG